MGRVEDTLAGMGVTVPKPVTPVGAYTPALRSGSLVFTSGQLPAVDGALVATGKVGEGSGLVDPELAKQAAQACAVNCLAAIREVTGDLDKVVRVVKVVGFVASDPSFTGQPGVVNGASELFGAAFGDAGVHARSAVGVVALPMDAAVEVECIVEVRD